MHYHWHPFHGRNLRLVKTAKIAGIDDFTARRPAVFSTPTIPAAAIWSVTPASEHCPWWTEVHLFRRCQAEQRIAAEKLRGRRGACPAHFALATSHECRRFHMTIYFDSQECETFRSLAEMERVDT
ncbi:MAG: hypothetical protein ACRD7E_03260 [Bryobacteraceae bacterium]